MSDKPTTANIPSHQEDEAGYARQQSMLLACETGHLAQLRQLFEATGVHQNDPVQAAVLSFLLANYPDFDLKNGAILGAAFRNPDLDTFQILYTHCPSIVDYEDDDGIDNALTMAFKLTQSPLLPGYLLDHGADPNNGGLGGFGPLYWAVQYNQLLEIMKKMVEVGGEVKSIIVASAVEKQDLELAKFFIAEWWCEDRDCMLEWALKEARKTNKEKLITMIEQRLKVEEHSRDRDRGQLRSSNDRSASEKFKHLKKGGKEREPGSRESGGVSGSIVLGKCPWHRELFEAICPISCRHE